MKLAEVKEMAKKLGVKVAGNGKAEKGDLIKAIQEKEGNFPCFGTASGSCDQAACLWRRDCIPN